jgi:hypothetical protein
LQGGDVATAQSLLDASGCTCPTGQLWSRVYDDRGNEYKVPEWLVLEPSGIVEDGDVSVVEDKIDGSAVLDTSEPDGKCVVRVRLSDASKDLRVSVRKRETIASIREKIKVQAKVCLLQQLPTVPALFLDRTKGSWAFGRELNEVC